MKKLIFVLCILVYIIRGYGQVGEEAKDFSLNTLDHGKLSFADYKGKVIVLYFFYSF